MTKFTLGCQDNLFKAVIVIATNFLVSNESYSVIDKYGHGLIRAYRNRNNSDDEEDEKKKRESKEKILKLLPDGKSTLKYKDKEIYATVKHHDTPINIMESMRFQIDVVLETDESVEFLEEFCNHCYEEYEKTYLGKIKKKDYVTHFVWDESYWDDLSSRKKRKLETISLNDTSDNLLKELKHFLSTETEELYENLGVNYKKNYLLEGVPGTGKTSLIFSLASELNYNIAILNFDSKLTDVKFLQAIQKLPRKCFLVIEDVDHLFIERKKNDEFKNAITFSGILNVLDGFGSQHKLVTFITTNHECVLDSAFKRPGRVDKIVHFDYATKEQINHMYARFLPNQLGAFKEFYKKIKNYKITTAVLQTFLFQWRLSDNIIDHVDELIELAKKNEYNKIGTNMFS